MKLRCDTLLDALFLRPKTIKKTFVFLMVLCSCAVFSQEDIKKDAGKLFEEEDYSKAYKLYSQLVANYPKDPEYNYKLGVCMIFSEPDKKKSLPYLLFAKRNATDATKDVTFWVGKAYHINYLFDDAIKNYDEYKKTASSAKQKKLQVDREIKACNNGKKLLRNLTDLVVSSKKELNESDYFRSYDLKDIGGKLLVKPEEFKSAIDRKKKDGSIVFLPKTSNRVYYSSYGDNMENGRDIYFSVKLANGTFSKGEKVKGINTEFDEDYPFLHPNGQTLYFASKGHNSMGGYDIFKSTYDETNDSWSAPVNLEFPINSPDDDYLFVTDSLEKTAFFSTGRQSIPGKIDVLKINTERKPIDLLVIKGSVLKPAPEQSQVCNISIKNTVNESPVVKYVSDDNGDYNLELPNGAKLLFTVETPGQKTQSEEITLPLVTVSKPLRQTITYVDGQLKITNYFDDEPTDDNYLQYLKVIEKKAKLEVNEGENKITTSSEEPIAKNAPPKKNSSPQLVDQVAENTSTSANNGSTTNNGSKGLDNKQLSNIAKQDAAELQAEATKLKQDSKDALEVGLQQKTSAEKKLIAANDLLKTAESIQNEDEKKSVILKAEQLKLEGEQEAALANKILSFGKSLEEDAELKQKEAQLNTEYSEALDKAILSKKNSAESQTNLDNLQKQIVLLDERKPKSEDIVNAIMTDIDEKEKQLAKLDQQNADINLNLNEIKTVVSENETELARTKKKKDKELIINQNNELKAEQAEKENQVANNISEIKKINEELSALKNELGLANKIKTETIAPVETVTAVALATNVSTTTQKTTNAKQNQTLANASKKQEKTIKTTSEKTTKPITKNTDSPDYTPLTANSYPEAISKLDNLNSQLAKTNDNEVFDFNGYQNPQAQNLKIEADAKINEAIALQKKLKETITTSKESISAHPAKVNDTNRQAQLTKEADEMVIKAQSLRSQSDKKEGDEKEKLLVEAKELENKADETYIQAAGVTKEDNKAIFDINSGNIENLINENKSSEIEIAEAKKLNEEAIVSFKKAAEIREEANSLTSAGAKLGNLSNAEEIESLAISKQQKAIDLLKRNNPEFVLKTPVTSTNPDNSVADTTNLARDLQKVNTEIDELAAVKIQSYQKLYEANSTEIEQVTASISLNQPTLDKTPGLKSEFEAAGIKQEAIKSLKQKSDDTSTPGEKLAKLTDAIKKQVEVIKQLNKVNSSLNKIVDNNALLAQKKANEVVKTSPPEETPDAQVATNSTSTTPSVAKEVVTPDEKRPENQNEDLVNIASFGTEDTTAGQVVNYFEKNTTPLKNPQAEASVKKSLNQFKIYGDEMIIIDEKIKNYQPDNATAEGTPDLKTKADNLLIEAETLSGKAFAIRNEANEKSGSEKDTLLARANEFENLSQNKKLEASALTLQANAKEYATNAEAINELLEKLKTDNPVLASELQSKNNESKILYDQSKQLREEANSLNNTSAKLGALSNAEEKEAETTQKQTVILNELKKQYPNYTVRSDTKETPENLASKRSELLEKQHAELTNLTNSFSLEFEAAKTSAPERLTEVQARLKQNADELNSESKQLLIKASQETNGSEKIKLLTLAAKTGNAAIMQLNKVIPDKQLASVKKPGTDDALKTIGETIAANNSAGKTTKTNKPAVTNKTKNAESSEKSVVRIEGLEVLKGNAYNNARPIPIDARIEDGLVFRVQIGAFKTRLPDNAFRGLSPLNGETTNSGYIRYTAGNFNKIENANAVKNDLRGLGYSDAFVVVYYNGKRISLNEALEIMAKEGKSIDTSAPATAGITAKSNIPKVVAPTQTTNLPDQEKVLVTKELEELNGLLYTVQIGVYTKQTTSSRLLNLKPIFTERLANGLYRYTAGIYKNAERLITDKNRVVLFGVKDAFVTAYLNGKRIPFNEGKLKQAEDTTIRMEEENPIIFPETTVTNGAVEQQIQTPVSAPATTVQPFKNDVSAYPTPTGENGVKSNEEGITFKVQIGAYSRQVPEDIAAKFSAIKTWPIENKQINTLFIYNIGNFTEPKFAKALKDEVVKLGINDAFITVYRDGVKLYGTDAASLLSR